MTPKTYTHKSIGIHTSLSCIPPSGDGFPNDDDGRKKWRRLLQNLDGDDDFSQLALNLRLDRQSQRSEPRRKTLSRKGHDDAKVDMLPSSYLIFVIVLNYLRCKFAFSILLIKLCFSYVFILFFFCCVPIESSQQVRALIVSRTDRSFLARFSYSVFFFPVVQSGGSSQQVLSDRCQEVCTVDSGYGSLRDLFNRIRVGFFVVGC